MQKNHPATARLTRKWIVGAAAAGLLAGCGGTDPTAGIQGSGAPVAASVTAVGPINAFGSIILDGVEYATSSAQVRIDDEPGTESQLHVGQIVTIKGTLNADGKTGTATEVFFSDDLRGPATQIDVSNATFVVLGTTVRVTDATLFDETSGDLSGLQSGAVVHVSGFANAAGELVASRIDLASGTVSLQVRGTVQMLDTVAHTFHINALTVDYNGIAPTGTLANGSVVTVEGGTTLSPSGVLSAQGVQVSAGLAAAANDSGRIEGVVTSFVSSADFAVNGQHVVTNSSTQFLPQGAILGLNVAVKVRGTFNASGALVASSVEVEPQSLSLVRGGVGTVSSSTNTLMVLGVTVTTDGATSFEDQSSLHIRRFRLNDVSNGDYVEVRGTTNPSGGGLIATLLERRQLESNSYVQGVVTSVADPSFTVLGITVTTSAQTRFLGLGGLDQAAGQFFAQARDHIVKVRGTWSSGTFVADQVQIVR